MKMERMKRELKYQYHIIQHAWNAYLRMVHIDYTDSCICPKCLDNPDVIIMDGITMGTCKELPEEHFQFDEDQQYSQIPQNARLFIATIKLRKQVQTYSVKGLGIDIFNEMQESLMEEFSEYIRYSCIFTEIDVKISLEFPNVKEIVYLLSRSEPISGLFQFSLLTSSEQQSIVQLSMEKSVASSIVLSICRKIYSLGVLFNSLPTTCGGQFTILHPNVANLLKCVILKIKALHNFPTRTIIEIEPKSRGFFVYFPAFKKNYK